MVNRLALGKIAEYLRDAGTLFNKFDTNVSEVELLTELYAPTILTLIPFFSLII
jgi:hypothetical protein